MFYSEAILSKQSPLSKVWLASHWERKLTKNQFLQTNLHNSVDAIMGTDQAPMALRLSGQLLLGVVRIYSRKTKYLLEDCNEAMVKIKVAFRTDAANKGDNNLLMLDGSGGLAGMPVNQARAAFNAVTVADTVTELDLLLPAQNFDIDAWGLNPKLASRTGDADISLNDDDQTGDLFSLDHGRRNRTLDIEMGRNHRLGGGGGYNAMDFDLAGPDDALDLDIFGDDLGGGDATEYDFMKRPRPEVYDDLEIEVGRREAIAHRRSLSADPFGMMAENEKGLRLGSEDGRASSVHGSINGAQDQPAFELAALGDSARAPLHFELADAVEGENVEGQEGEPLQAPQPRQAVIKKRKLIVDDITEMTQGELNRLNADLVAEGLLMTHDMLPRSRKLLRLQQIEQDAAHGGLAGYLLDCTAGPRIGGGSMVPELASMFSRRLQIDQAVPEEPAEVEENAQENGAESSWLDEQVESWVDQVEGAGLGVAGEDIREPSLDLFDDVRLESPPCQDQAQNQGLEQGTEAVGFGSKTKSSLFQESGDMNGSNGTATKELHGTVFSTSAIQTMKLVQQGLGAKKTGTEEELPRATRQASMVTASSALNKSTAQVTFTELLEGPAGTEETSLEETTAEPVPEPAAKPKPKAKRNRADAAKLFFELLVLSTKDVVALKQEESFGEISVGGSPWLETLIEADTETASQVAASQA
ncbi:sister chromatid cohesion protein 1 [Podila epigama]|nr:sister chromatid cohesion protein 1 [Podila epigama]